jgi:hypothetical protein
MHIIGMKLTGLTMIFQVPRIRLLDSVYIVRALIPKVVIHDHYDAREDYSKGR